MNDNKSAPLPLWRVALLELVAFIKAEWHWVVGVIAVYSMAQILVFSKLISLLQQMGPTDKEAAAAKLKEILPQLVSTAIPTFVVASVLSIVTTYVFSVLYFKHTERKADAVFSLRRIFSWLWALLRKFLVMMVPPMLGGAVVAALVLFNRSDKVGDVTALLLFAFLLSCVAGYFYLWLRYYFVSPHALLGASAPLKSSWAMTSGRLWRLFWGLIVVMLVMYFFMIFPHALVGFVFKAYGPDAPLTKSLEVLASGLWNGILSVSLPLYACSAYRVFAAEDKAAAGPDVVQEVAPPAQG